MFNFSLIKQLQLLLSYAVLPFFMSQCEYVQESMGKLSKLHPEKLRVHFCTELNVVVLLFCIFPSAYQHCASLSLLVQQCVFFFFFSLQSVLGMQEVALLVLPG